MKDLFIQTPARIFTSKEHGTRLIFTNGSINPRDMLGKIGVTFHSAAAAVSRRVVKVKLIIRQEDDEEELRDVYLNRSSLIKYLAAHRKEEIPSVISDQDIVNLLNSTLKDPAYHTELRHAGQHNKRLLEKDEAGEQFRGKFFSWLYQKTIQTLAKLKKRFIFAKTEKSYFNISEILAKFRFKKAVEEVPAYRAHVQNDEAFSATSLKSFRDVPLTSKDNYIKPNAKHDWDLHRGGDYPDGHIKVDTSTGTTGKPTTWVRGDEEIQTVINSFKIAAEIEYGARQLNYINAFALGPWATGMTAYEMMRATGKVFATGADIDKILDRLELIYAYENHLIDSAIQAFVDKNQHHLLGEAVFLKTMITEVLSKKMDDKNFDIKYNIAELAKTIPLIQRFRRQITDLVLNLDRVKSQIIITGYPPFLKDLVDEARVRGIDFSKYQARGVVGGQAISEALRDALIREGFSKINSSYGASDCDINIGVETDFEMQFRKILEKNPAIARDLYDTQKGLPMVFHYDPLNYHVESDEKDDLIFTCNRSDRSSPRIRYALGDKGRVFAASDLEAVLVKHGIVDLKPKINFPLLFVWGRESSVAYRGSKVSFTDLERAMINADVDNKCVKRAFYSYQDEEGGDQFEIWVELRDGEHIPLDDERKQFLAKLLLGLAEVNQDFAHHLNLPDRAVLPALRYFRRGMSPMGESTGHHKQVQVFTSTNLPKDFREPKVATDMSVTWLDKKDLHACANRQFNRKGKEESENGVGYGSASPRFMRHSDSSTVLLEAGSDPEIGQRLT